LVLHKDVAGSWGPANNYETYPEMLETKLQEHNQQAEQEDGESASATSRNQLALKVFWAEKDWMITKKGERYFDKCFQRFTQDNQSSSDQPQTCLSYESEVVPDTVHDTVPLPQYGALSKMLEDILRERHTPVEST
jgi:hypothetical protein